MNTKNLENFALWRLAKVVTLFVFAFFWLSGILMIWRHFTYYYHDSHPVFDRYGRYIGEKNTIRYQHNFGEWRYIFIIAAILTYTGFLAMALVILKKISLYVMYGNEEKIPEIAEKNNSTENLGNNFEEHFSENREENDDAIIITETRQKIYKK